MILKYIKEINRCLFRANVLLIALMILPIKYRNDSFLFKAPTAEMYFVEITTLSGSLVHHLKVGWVEGENEFDVNINLTSFAAHIFYLIIRSDTGALIDKVNLAKFRA